MSSTIGELKGIKDGVELEWRISDFFNLSDEQNISYKCPTFDFAGAPWYIKLYPNGHNTKDSIGTIDCYLIKVDTKHSVTLQYEFGLKKTDGKIDKECRSTYAFPEKADGRGCTRLISRAKLLERKDDLAPSNVVTIICRLTRERQNIVSNPPVRRAEKLSNDLRDLMLNGNASDLTIKLKEKEFKLHKIILGIRSPAFATMVKKEMAKNSVDIIDINDCEEVVFKMFLEYVYAGTIDGDLSQKNFLDLYKIAEKYEVAELMEECLKCVKDKLSIATFFDAIELAEKYNEKDLKLSISKFCSDNLKDLVKNPKWLTFMQENTEKAYELISTALTNYVKSKDE